MRRVVFLDRDGVINRELFRNGQAQAPWTVSEVEILPGVPDALVRLRRNEFLLVVVTNQPDVVRGAAAVRESGDSGNVTAPACGKSGAVRAG